MYSKHSVREQLQTIEVSLILPLEHHSVGARGREGAKLVLHLGARTGNQTRLTPELPCARLQFLSQLQFGSTDFYALHHRAFEVLRTSAVQLQQIVQLRVHLAQHFGRNEHCIPLIGVAGGERQTALAATTGHENWRSAGAPRAWKEERFAQLKVSTAETYGHTTVEEVCNDFQSFFEAF
jgi:hypothetical protein